MAPALRVPAPTSATLRVLALWLVLSLPEPARGQAWWQRRTTPAPSPTTAATTTTPQPLNGAEATCVARELRNVRSRLSFLYETSFAFQGGGYSSEAQGSIEDGGRDMYDGGNMLFVSLSDRDMTTPLSYNQRCEGFLPDVGDIQHITCKFEDSLEMGLPALFVAIVVDPKARINAFGTKGDLGADGQGRVEGSYVGPSTFTDRPIMGYYKLVNSAGPKPSVNQLVITESGHWNNQYAMSSNSGDQYVSLVSSSDSTAWVIYVLWAGRNGYSYSPEDVSRVMGAFVEGCFSSSSIYPETSSTPGHGLPTTLMPHVNNDGDLRLSGGSTADGYLEVYHDGLWGTVCDDEFDERDAQVACRQLGFPAGQRSYQTFAAQTGPIWLDELHCHGHEEKLSQCPHAGWGAHDCTPVEAVAVTCSVMPLVDGDLRLSGGSTTDGFLEVYYDGLWGTVCDDQFDVSDAKVACRQLGFPTGYPSHQSARPQTTQTGPIWLDETHCYGNEEKLSQCPHAGWGAHDCTHDEDVAVTCLGATSTTLQLRDLSFGATLRQEGDDFLQVYFNGTWGTIGEDGFNDLAAEVACRQLGLPTARPSVVVVGADGEPTWPGFGFHCTGTEHSLANCDHTRNGAANQLAVSVRCYEDIEQESGVAMAVFGILACACAACIAYACYRKCCRFVPLYLDKVEQDDDDEESDFDIGYFAAPAYWENRDLTENFDVRCEVSRKVVNTVQHMLQATWRDIQTRDRKDGTLPKRLEVVNVQRVEDRDMWVKYCTQKERIRQSRDSCTPVELLDGDPLTGHVATLEFAQTLAGESLDQSLNEHYLFHGSSPEGAEGISEHGFQLDRAGQNAGKMFGAGAYFAEMCSKADEYATSGHGLYKGIYAMLLCRVTNGEMCRFLRSDHRGIEQALDTGRFDGVLGDRAASVGTYREFVVYRESQIYPEYVVLYRRIIDDSDDDDSHDP